jgi:hypothetical protein
MESARIWQMMQLHRPNAVVGQKGAGLKVLLSPGPDRALQHKTLIRLQFKYALVAAE